MAHIATVLLTDDPAYDEALTHIPGARVLHRSEELPTLTELGETSDILHTEATPNLPLTEEKARELIDANGQITVAMPFDLEHFADADDSENTIWDMMHNDAFTFGFAAGASWRLCGVLSDTYALIEYSFSWHVYTAMAGDDDDHE